MLVAQTVSPHYLQAEALTSPNDSLEVQIPLAPTPFRIDGRTCLAYELHITNFRGASLTLSRIEVLDADRGGSALHTYEGQTLTAGLARLGGRPASSDSRLIASGERVVFFAWLEFDDSKNVPLRLGHRIFFRFGEDQMGTVQIAPINVGQQRAVVLSPPLRGGPWVAVYDPSLNGGHRRVLFAIDGKSHIPARFAVDWIKLGPDGTVSRGDSSIPTNSYSYSADVVAVAGGKVAALQDGFPEPTPRQSFDSDAGNYLALDIGGGRFAFYEHLKPGSIKVRIGERVRTGQLLASVGASGSVFSGAHLHFHVADASSPLNAEGTPFVFKDFEELGSFASMETFAMGKPWLPPPGSRTTRQSMVMPKMLSVLRFSDSSD